MYPVWGVAEKSGTRGGGRSGDEPGLGGVSVVSGGFSPMNPSAAVRVDGVEAGLGVGCGSMLRRRVARRSPKSTPMTSGCRRGVGELDGHRREAEGRVHR